MRDKKIAKEGELSDSDDEGDNRKHEQSFKEDAEGSSDEPQVKTEETAQNMELDK